MRTALLALPPTCLLVWLASCVATPLPDPPSVDSAQMTLVAQDPMSVTLAGQAGAVDPGGITLRVSNPAAAVGVVEVAVDAQGAFSANVPGVVGDPLFLEDAASERFLAAVGTDGAGGVIELDPGPDSDNDGSPDIVDCDDADDTVLGSACGGTCSTDADCDPGYTCLSGTCGK